VKIKTGELAMMVDGVLEGDPDIWITHPSKIEQGEAGSICFLGNPKYESYLYRSQASAVLVSKTFVPREKINPALIRVEDVYLTVGKLLHLFNGQDEFVERIDPTAIIDENARVEHPVIIGAQTIISSGCSVGKGSRIHGQVYLGPDVTVGERTILYPGVKIYHGCVIGDDCTLHSNVVIGSDGFGFSKDEKGEYQKIPQLGIVEIGSKVEIGANTTIDRGTMGSTRIGNGCKLDNLIQIAHNVSIGDNTVIAAQAGIAGSTHIGSNCQIGGQVGIAGHLIVADGTRIQAQSGVASSLEEVGGKWYGSPAIEYFAFLRSFAEFKALPLLAKRLKALEDRFKN